MKKYPNSPNTSQRLCRLIAKERKIHIRRQLTWHEVENRHWFFCYQPQSEQHVNSGRGQPRSQPDWPAEPESFCSWLPERPNQKLPIWWASSVVLFANGPHAFSHNASKACMRPLAEVPRAFFPPHVAVHVVRLACERPDNLGRRLSQWDCQELARKLVDDELAASISPSTVRRILESHTLKPWRHHMWLNPKHPRDVQLYDAVSDMINLYTGELSDDDIVLSIDEKTSLQPRPREFPTQPAQPGNTPNLCEHEDTRDGALNLFAAFDTRSGHVYGQCAPRKRHKEFMAFLDYVDADIDETMTTIHLVCDHAKNHTGKQTHAWLAKHPRFVVHVTPVHCSWMNQIEQWFSILQRKRLRIVDFTSKQDLQAKVEHFIREWNEHAHPFNWSKKSVAKVMADVPAMAA